MGRQCSRGGGKVLNPQDASPCLRDKRAQEVQPRVSDPREIPLDGFLSDFFPEPYTALAP